MNDDGKALIGLLNSSPRLAAFLRVIREGESGQDPDAYRMIVGGGFADNLEDHPRKLVYIPSLKVSSTAAGAYQFLSRTWDECAKALELTDFSKVAQDAACVFLIRRRKALPAALAGNLEEAIRLCNREWASLPGSPYGQPVMTMEKAKQVYAQWLPENIPEPEPEPELALQPEKPKEKKMAPFVLAAATELFRLIPSLIKKFGSGSKVAERNAVLAESVVEVVTSAVGAKNAQEAVEIVRADPSMLQVADKAVQQSWFALQQLGPEGVKEAREADARAVANGARAWHSPSFLVAVALLPLVYLIVGSVVGLFGTEWPPEVRAAIAGSVTGAILGGLIGYYYGQTTSRNRPPEANPKNLDFLRD